MWLRPSSSSGSVLAWFEPVSNLIVIKNSRTNRPDTNSKRPTSCETSTLISCLQGTNDCKIRKGNYRLQSIVSDSSLSLSPEPQSSPGRRPAWCWCWSWLSSWPGWGTGPWSPPWRRWRGTEGEKIWTTPCLGMRCTCRFKKVVKFYTTQEIDFSVGMERVRILAIRVTRIESMSWHETRESELYQVIGD